MRVEVKWMEVEVVEDITLGCLLCCRMLRSRSMGGVMGLRYRIWSRGGVGRMIRGLGMYIRCILRGGLGHIIWRGWLRWFLWGVDLERVVLWHIVG